MPSLPPELKAAAHVVVGMAAALAVYLLLM